MAFTPFSAPYPGAPGQYVHPYYHHQPHFQPYYHHPHYPVHYHPYGYGGPVVIYGGWPREEEMEMRKK